MKNGCLEDRLAQSHCTDHNHVAITFGFSKPWLPFNFSPLASGDREICAESIYIISDAESFCLAFRLLLADVHLEDRRIDGFDNGFWFLNHTSKTLFMLLCVCSVIDHRWRQNLAHEEITKCVSDILAIFCSVMFCVFFRYRTTIKRTTLTMHNWTCTLPIPRTVRWQVKVLACMKTDWMTSENWKMRDLEAILFDLENEEW